ncbi:hypothetical protein F4821DRAFT_279700 [Hypoxylon rubiginosum]|uniref:Uncharacterized protein n=1 Tax=Hypoxylon rubiginosum TaxID=110542 RepID=A0ACC0CXI9_9PEZI|nr:hypothetical protein F4821DRAFT_279700 [Hypoxylon rubiginosum]
MSGLRGFFGLAAPPKPPGPAFEYRNTSGYVDAPHPNDQANYDQWKSSLTLMTMSLQNQLPEVRATALLEFVESPQVALSFIEFVLDFWHHNPDIRPRGSPLPRKVIEWKEIEAAVVLFNRSKLSGPRHAPHPVKDEWKPRHHIAHFMRCVYKWAVQDVGGLSILPHLETNWQRTAILMGALMVCIRVYDSGSFQAYQNITGSQYGQNHHSPWLSPEYFIWRARHSVDDQDATQRAFYLAHQTAQEYAVMDRDKRVSNATWFRNFAYYARNDFAIQDQQHYRWLSDIGFYQLDDTRVARSSLGARIYAFLIAIRSAWNNTARFILVIALAAAFITPLYAFFGRVIVPLFIVPLIMLLMLGILPTEARWRQVWPDQHFTG